MDTSKAKLNNKNKSEPTYEVIDLNFRGTIVQLNSKLLVKLPQQSHFNTYLQSSYGLTLKTIGKKTNNVPLINRSVYMFNHILDYLEDGDLHFPHCLCIDVILKELQFWGLQQCALSECCMDRVLTQEEDKETNEKISKGWEQLSMKMTHVVKDGIGHKQGMQIASIKSGEVDPNRKELNDETGSKEVVKITPDSSNMYRMQSKCDKLHEILNNPGSCVVSKVIACAIILSIFLSIVILAVESEPVVRRPTYAKLTADYNSTVGVYRYYYQHSTRQAWLIYVDLVLTAILTIDLVLRLILSNNKAMFLRQPLTITDVLGVLPIWILFCMSVYLRVTKEDIHSGMKYAYYVGLVRILRIFRFGHITMHNKKLRVVVLALRCSWRELLILFILIAINSFLFGLLIFYVEIWSEDTFLTIFEGQWWAIITMTTVGYGDFYPKSILGRVVGVLCSLTGIVVVAMATSVLVNNFLTIYKCVEKIERSKNICSIKKKTK